MGFSGSHNYSILISLCNADMLIFIIKTNTQHPNNTDLIFTVHGFSSIPFLHKSKNSGLFSTLLPDGVTVARQTLNLFV